MYKSKHFRFVQHMKMMNLVLAKRKEGAHIDQFQEKRTFSAQFVANVRDKNKF